MTAPLNTHIQSRFHNHQ